MAAAIRSCVATSAPITAETSILQDLNFDSVAVLDFIMDIETKFDTIIPMSDMAEIETVGDLVRVLSNSLKVA